MTRPWWEPNGTLFRSSGAPSCVWRYDGGDRPFWYVSFDTYRGPAGHALVESGLTEEQARALVADLDAVGETLRS